MKREMRITVQGEKLIVESGKHREELANLLALSQKNTIVSIGETRQQILDSAPETARALVSEHRFVPILSADELTTGIPMEIAEAGLRYIATQMGAKSPLFSSLNTIALTLDFPGYEKLPAETREDFEFGLQYGIGPLDMRVNGQAVGASARTARIATISFEVLKGLWWVAMLGSVAAVRYPIFGARIPVTMGILLMLASVTILPPVTMLLWLVLLKHFVPVRLVAIIFYNDISNWIIRKWYARLGARILGEPIPAPAKASE